MFLPKWLSGKQPFVTIKCRQVNSRLMEGDRGRGRSRENGAGSGIPKVAGSGREREKLFNNAQLFRNRKHVQRREPKNTGREPGVKRTGSGSFNPPVPPRIKLHACNSSRLLITD